MEYISNKTHYDKKGTTIQSFMSDEDSIIKPFPGTEYITGFSGFASQYLSDIKLFNATAKQWVEEYANPEKTLQKKIKELVEMGFTEDKAKEALEKNEMDVEKALNSLLGQ